MAKLMKTSFLSMVIAAVTLAGILVNATAASATDKDATDRITIAGRLNQFFNETQFGESLKALAGFVGLGIIVYVAVTQLTKVTSSGAGVMTAIPPILLACIIGGILMNVTLFIKIFAWVMEAGQRAIDAMADLVSDPPNPVQSEQQLVEQ